MHFNAWMRQTKQLKLMSIWVELHRIFVSLFGVTIASKVKVITGKIDGDFSINYLFTENKILFEIREKDQSAGISAARFNTENHSFLKKHFNLIPFSINILI